MKQIENKNTSKLVINRNKSKILIRNKVIYPYYHLFFDNIFIKLSSNFHQSLSKVLPRNDKKVVISALI